MTYIKVIKLTSYLIPDEEQGLKERIFWEALINSNRLAVIAVMLMITQNTKSTASLTVYVHLNLPSEHFETIKKNSM